MDSSSVVTKLDKQQAKRLRFYFSKVVAQKHELDGVDLDLIGLKLIEIEPNKSWIGNTVKLTPLGVDILNQHRQATKQARSVHHDLGARLAEFLRGQGRITWENVEFRNHVNEPDIDYMRCECVRPDVFSILPALQAHNANPCIHEVKVSRADFLGDLARPEKRAAYARMSEAVYYVAPEGMITPSEVPQGFGLLVERKEGEFVLAKRPRKNKVNLQPHHYLNMIIKPGVYPESYGE